MKKGRTDVLPFFAYRQNITQVSGELLNNPFQIKRVHYFSIG